MAKRKTTGGAAEALEKMGGAVERGVESLTKDVKAAAYRTVSKASGMAKHAYPELVKRKATEGYVYVAGGVVGCVLALCFAVIAFVLLGYGLDFSGKDTAGTTRAVFFCIDVVAAIVSFSIGIAQIGIGLPDLRAPEGPVIDELLRRFLRK